MATAIFFNTYCLLPRCRVPFFDDLKRGMDFYLRLQRRGNAAILRFRELDSLRDRFRREPSAGKNVMNVHRRVLAWIVVTAFARNLHRVARYLLPFLFENAGDISRGARTKRDEQQFNWRRS